MEKMQIAISDTANGVAIYKHGISHSVKKEIGVTCQTWWVLSSSNTGRTIGYINNMVY